MGVRCDVAAKGHGPHRCFLSIECRWTGIKTESISAGPLDQSDEGAIRYIHPPDALTGLRGLPGQFAHDATSRIADLDVVDTIAIDLEIDLSILLLRRDDRTSAPSSLAMPTGDPEHPAKMGNTVRNRFQLVLCIQTGLRDAWQSLKDTSTTRFADASSRKYLL